jgi:hypothetical protein
MNRLLAGNDDEEVGLHRLLLFPRDKKEDARLRGFLRDLDDRFAALPENPSHSAVVELIHVFYDAWKENPNLRNLYLRTQPHQTDTEIIAQLRSDVQGMIWALRQTEHDDLVPAMSAWDVKLELLSENPLPGTGEKTWHEFSSELDKSRVLTRAWVAAGDRELLEAHHNSARDNDEIAKAERYLDQTLKSLREVKL